MGTNKSETMRESFYSPPKKILKLDKTSRNNAKIVRNFLIRSRLPVTDWNSSQNKGNLRPFPNKTQSHSIISKPIYDANDWPVEYEKIVQMARVDPNKPNNTRNPPNTDTSRLANPSRKRNSFDSTKPFIQTKRCTETPTCATSCMNGTSDSNVPFNQQDKCSTLPSLQGSCRSTCHLSSTLQETTRKPAKKIEKNKFNINTASLLESSLSHNYEKTTSCAESFTLATLQKIIQVEPISLNVIRTSSGQKIPLCDCKSSQNDLKQQNTNRYLSTETIADECEKIPSCPPACLESKGPKHQKITKSNKSTQYFGNETSRFNAGFSGKGFDINSSRISSEVITSKNNTCRGWSSNDEGDDKRSYDGVPQASERGNPGYSRTCPANSDVSSQCCYVCYFPDKPPWDDGRGATNARIKERCLAAVRVYRAKEFSNTVRERNKVPLIRPESPDTEDSPPRSCKGTMRHKISCRAYTGLPLLLPRRNSKKKKVIKNIPKHRSSVICCSDDESCCDSISSINIREKTSVEQNAAKEIIKNSKTLLPKKKFYRNVGKNQSPQYRKRSNGKRYFYPTYHLTRIVPIRYIRKNRIGELDSESEEFVSDSWNESDTYSSTDDWEPIHHPNKTILSKRPSLIYENPSKDFNDPRFQFSTEMYYRSKDEYPSTDTSLSTERLHQHIPQKNYSYEKQVNTEFKGSSESLLINIGDNKNLIPMKINVSSETSFRTNQEHPNINCKDVYNRLRNITGSRKAYFRDKKDIDSSNTLIDEKIFPRMNVNKQSFEEPSELGTLSQSMKIEIQQNNTNSEYLSQNTSDNFSIKEPLYNRLITKDTCDKNCVNEKQDFLTYYTDDVQTSTTDLPIFTVTSSGNTRKISEKYNIDVAISNTDLIDSREGMDNLLLKHNLQENKCLVQMVMNKACAASISSHSMISSVHSSQHSIHKGKYCTFYTPPNNLPNRPDYGYRTNEGNLKTQDIVSRPSATSRGATKLVFATNTSMDIACVQTDPSRSDDESVQIRSERDSETQTVNRKFIMIEKPEISRFMTWRKNYDKQNLFKELNPNHHPGDEIAIHYNKKYEDMVLLKKFVNKEMRPHLSGDFETQSPGEKTVGALEPLNCNNNTKNKVCCNETSVIKQNSHHNPLKLFRTKPKFSTMYDINKDKRLINLVPRIKISQNTNFEQASCTGLPKNFKKGKRRVGRKSSVNLCSSLHGNITQNNMGVAHLHGQSDSKSGLGKQTEIGEKYLSRMTQNESSSYVNHELIHNINRSNGSRTFQKRHLRRLVFQKSNPRKSHKTMIVKSSPKRRQKSRKCFCER